MGEKAARIAELEQEKAALQEALATIETDLLAAQALVAHGLAVLGARTAS